MPTLRQRKVAKAIVENLQSDEPLTAGKMLEKVRYGKISKQPSRVIESEGVQEALEDLGFTEDNAKKVVSEIMLDSDNDANARLKATDQVFKVKGSYASEHQDQVNILIPVLVKFLDKKDERTNNDRDTGRV